MQNNQEAEKKQPNPRSNANPLSILFFLHILPVLWRNYKKQFKEDKLFDVLEEHKSSNLGNQLEGLWHKTHKKYKKYALHLALWKMFYVDIILSGVFHAVKDVALLIFLPYAVGQLVSYFGSTNNGVDERSAYLHATVIILSFLIDRIVAHFLWLWLKHLSMKMRVGCCSLIYRKSLRLSLKSLHQTSIGHIVNLLSNDVGKFDSGFVLCHYLWVAPLQAAVATYMLYRIIGVAAFTGMVFILSFVPLQIYLGKVNSLVRLKTALRTDERVRLMNEILSGIQIIKMYTWERPFAKLIALARRYEMAAIRYHFYIESFIFSLDMFVTRTSVFITIVIYLTLGHEINADVTYSVMAIYNVIRTNITLIFSLSIACMGEIHISVLRVAEFLSFEEKEPVNTIQHSNVNGISNDAFKVPKISLQNVCAKWSSDKPTDTLTNLNLQIDQNQLVAIIGPVGSGKSTLLSVLLNEVPVTAGVADVRGNISYASQDPWLFLGSVRQNILFGEPFDQVRYQSVIHVCALESDFKMFQFGDRTIVREKGKSLSGGQRARISLARSIYKKADIYLLDDPLSAVDTKVGKQLYDECIRNFLSDKLCILVTHQLQYLQNADKIVILNNGTISNVGTYNELQTKSLDFVNVLNEVHDEKPSDTIIRTYSSSEELKKSDENDEEPEDEKEEVATGNLGFGTYMEYFRHGGNAVVITTVVLIFTLSHAVANGGDYFVSYWINTEEEASLSSRNNEAFIDRPNMIYWYTGITIGTIIMGLAHSTVLFTFLIEASKNMHNIVFAKIVHATMYFFNHNPTGRILNRFSRDMGIVDEYIPYVLIDILDISFILLCTIILSCLVNPWFLVPYIGLLFVLYMIRNVYIQTSRQVKRIEGITRSPIYNHATSTVNGLTTIRAYNAQKMLISEYDNIQDNHNSAWYLYISSSEAFGLWIDIVCVIFIALIVFSFLLLNKGYYGGDVGLIITLYIALAGLLQWGIFQWSELENNMTSAERILEYAKLETEPNRPAISNIPKDWPEFGKVVFDNVCMKYDANGPLVLKNLNFVVHPGEKIGVVGRTGAGKTSTITALFQFYPLSGGIIIDGIDTTKLPLETLRSNISIIPQECLLFSGSMRKNLDPFDEYSDDVLWNALEQVEIKNIFEEIPGGLNTHITDSGSNFSFGQRQLICLARAIIRRNKIIVMDEATANIDTQTDFLIQKTIRKNFTDCTIFTIAHRLHTIMDSDRVLVMDKGQIVEFEVPYVLLQKEKGVFQTMVQTTGARSAKHLFKIAEDAYKLKLNKLDQEN